MLHYYFLNILKDLSFSKLTVISLHGVKRYLKAITWSKLEGSTVKRQKYSVSLTLSLVFAI